MHLAGRFQDFEITDWQRIVDVNVLGTVRVTRAFLPQMIDEGRGRIINMASTAGKYGSLFQSPYNATKHAVVGITRCLALEAAASGVRVNAICPGFVETEMVDGAVQGFAQVLGIAPEQVVPSVLQRVPIGRLLQPEEIAELAVYLASGPGDAMTGQSLTIAGGLILV
jgi:NAD(P)-dependent dehydrogenase (short-subunit alcohol dehydrogenase family)